VVFAWQRLKKRRLVLQQLACTLAVPALAKQAAPLAQTDAQSAKVAPPAPWRPDHIVIVVLENLSAYDASERQRKGGHGPVYSPASAWRYLNELAEKGARCTQSHFTRTPYNSSLPTRPSQPNYLYLFSGHHQGVLPAWFEDANSPYTGTALRDRHGRLLSDVGLGDASGAGGNTGSNAGKDAKPATSRNSGGTTRIGIGNNQIPDAWLPFTSPNLGAAIMQGGGSFLSFSESLPYPSWNCGTDSSLVPCSAAFAVTDDYRRKHNAAVNWTDAMAPTSKRGREGDLARNVMPVSVNLALDPSFDPLLKQSFRGFANDAQGKPLPFDTLPDVSIVVPNDQHNAHSNSAKVADDWLRQHIGPYAEWAMKHNSLLIITFDEDGSTDNSQGDGYMTGAHRIPTVFYGAGVVPGVREQRMDHLNVLATVLWLHGALDRFEADFKRFHKVVEGSGSEAEKEWLNLQPLADLFVRINGMAPVKASG
jgi:hypothetical protein